MRWGLKALSPLLLWHDFDMTFRSGMKKPSNRAHTSGGGRGGRIAAGGGIGSIILVGLFLLLGGNPAEIGQITGGGQSQGTGEFSGSLDHCDTSDTANQYTDCRIEYTALSVDEFWTEALPQQAGIEYQRPEVVVFDGTTQSACGTASNQTGPFYCPGDDGTYFEPTFFDQLTQYGGENTPFAQMYIVAHEFAHHIQKLEGTLSLSNYNDPGADSGAVRIELQADCYAGMWANYAASGESQWIEEVTEEQVRDAITAARAVGDDNIQERATGEVRPDTFTHGTSEQRQNAFLTGYREGKMSACDTLGRDVYNS